NDCSSHTTTASSDIARTINLSHTTHTNDGNSAAYASTFTDTTGNFNNASGTVHDSIAKATPSVTVTPYSVTYDGSAHTATASSVSAGTFDLSATTHTNVDDHPRDAWTFTDSTGNFSNASGTVHDSIAKATLSVTVIVY